MIKRYNGTAGQGGGAMMQRCSRTKMEWGNGLFQLFPWLLLSFFLLSASVSYSQAGATFEAFSNAKQVVANGYFDVSFTLKNGEGTDFRPPSFNDFVVISGPSRSVSTTIINGKMSKEMSYSFSLQPRRVGTFTLGSASVKVGNEVLRTQPLNIQVLPAREQQQGDNQVYIKAEASINESVVGQQITLDYKLYTTVNVESYNVLEESDYQGFYAEDVRRHDGRVVREVIGGVQFLTKIIKRIALFPQQAGALTIDPLHVQLGIVKDNEQRRSNFFFNRQIQRLNVQTEPLAINVNPLPANAPSTFTGAVGKFSMASGLTRELMTTDDALTLRMSLEGNGDIKRVQAPDIDFPAGFEVYDPKVIDESTYENGGLVVGKKVVDYLLIPKNPGIFEVHPEFTYYDTDSLKYVTLRSNPSKVTVKQGSNNVDPADFVTEDEDQKELADIRFIKTDKSIKLRKDRFFGSPLFWVLAGLPFFVLFLVLLYRRREASRKTIDPLLLKSRRARKVAVKKLEKAESYMKEGQSREFYDEIFKAMLGYVCDKLRIPLSELTKENVKERLVSLSVKEAHIERFMDIIQTSEMAVFAGMDNAKSMQGQYDATVQVITEIEADLS